MRFSVSPSRVHVLSRDGFYVTVEGSGFGSLSCQGSRRWVFGTFEEKFLLRNPPTTPASIVISGVGLSGSWRASVSVEARASLHAPVVFGNPRFRRPLTLPITRKPWVHPPLIRGLRARLAARWNEFRNSEAQRSDET